MVPDAHAAAVAVAVAAAKQTHSRASNGFTPSASRYAPPATKIMLAPEVKFQV